MTKRVISIIVVGAVAMLTTGSIVGITMVKPKPTLQASVAAPAAEQHKELNVSQDDVSPAPEVTPEETPVEVTPSPKASPRATSSPQMSEAPVETTYQWGNEMAAAGIAEADYSYVTQMLLDSNGWRTTGTPLWQNARTVKGATLTDKLVSANRWVLQYHGTWAAAYTLWTNAGNF